MKHLVYASLILVAMLLLSAEPSFAWRDHFRVWVGPPYPYYAYPYPYYSPSYIERPIIIQQQAPEVYVQPAQQKQAETAYWYYCQEPQGYYPYVKECPKGWMKVVPTPPAAQPGPPK